MKSAKATDDASVLFCLARVGNPFELPTAIVAIPRSAWRKMIDGGATILDMRTVGVPLRIVLVGAATPESAKAALDAAAAPAHRVIRA